MTDKELGAFDLADWAMLVTLALVWGSSFLLIEIGIEHFSPYQVAFLRTALAAGVLVAVPAARTRVARRDLPRVALLGTLWMAVPFVLFPLAQQWIDSSLAGMLNGAVPLFAAAIATLVARRLPPSGVMVGLLAGFGGIVLIGLPTVETAGTTLGGALLVLLATVFYGCALNLAVPLQRTYGAMPVVLRAQAFAAVLTAPLAAWTLPEASFAWSSTIAVAALGLFGTGLAMVLMTTLAGRVGASRGSIAIYFIPVVAIVLGVTFRGDVVHPLALVGTAVVIAGAWITSRAQRGPATSAPPPQTSPEPVTTSP